MVQNPNYFMHLSRKILADILPTFGKLPSEDIFSLPERVLQFGTGVLLRGLPDYFIDKANKQQIFNGRVVIVKSTAQGDTKAYNDQDGLYTILERGVVDGLPSEKIFLNASISRVLTANEDWDEIIECAANPQMQVIISNTTEVGITLVEADAKTDKPISFPGRLLFFLLERYRIFKGSLESGMVIIPTELIVDNGAKLKNIVSTLAKLKGESEKFIQWLETANDFCNSLVDCIVPGKLPVHDLQIIEKKLGYTDELMIMSEPYRLWAIETKSNRTREILSFYKADKSVILAPDITKFRELKLRLLNGSHTLSCGLAYLAGFVTVKEAMQDEWFVNYLHNLIHQEIIPLVLQDEITVEEASEFASQVIDRFKNPYIEHLWLNITVQYTSKIVMRTVPLVQKHFEKYTEAPQLMALGFAAFLLFMRSEKKEDNRFYGKCNGLEYRIQDDKAALLYNKWAAGQINSAIMDRTIFGADLTQFPHFEEAVSKWLKLLAEFGAKYTLRSIFERKSVT